MLNLWGEDVKTEEEVEEKVKAISLFDTVKRILANQDIRDTDPTLSSFDPFMVNKSLMQNELCIGYADVMNCNAHIPKYAQYMYYLYGMPEIGRRASWAKKVKDDSLNKLIELGYGERVATDMIYVLPSSRIKEIIKEK